MTLMLILGLSLAATSGVLVLRSFALARAGRRRTLDQIAVYGFRSAAPAVRRSIWPALYVTRAQIAWRARDAPKPAAGLSLRAAYTERGDVAGKGAGCPGSAACLSG